MGEIFRFENLALFYSRGSVLLQVDNKELDHLIYLAHSYIIENARNKMI